MVEKGNIREERLYLGNYERYRKYVNNILKTERQTLHIIDDRHRFALIDRLTLDNGITLSTATNSIRYQYDNHLGSASLELDQTAAIISYEEYHPFGTTSYRSGRTETEVSQKRYKYVGKERDEETGLYYYGARYYAAWLCRFVSVDPLQFKYPHYTPYQYAGNKPVSYIDLDGLEEAAAVSTYYTSPIISKFKNFEIEMEKVKEGQQKIEAFNQRFGKDTEQHIEGNLSSFISSSAFQFVRKVASHSSTAISTTQVIFEPFSKNWLSSSKGMFFMKHGDPVLDVSKGQFLEQNGIYRLKYGKSIYGNSNPVRMTDDLNSATKELNKFSKSINLVSSLFEGFNAWKETKDLSIAFGTGGLNYLINMNPIVSTLNSFGSFVMGTDKFREEQANYYKIKMSEYRNSNNLKYKEAENLYDLYRVNQIISHDPLVVKPENGN